MGREDFEAGGRVGDFAIEGRLGAGGMGVVYRARQVSLDRVVALKVLGGALTDPAAVARFRRAAQAAARLRHPHIAAVHFVGQDAAVCYLAMEYVDGASLQEVIGALAADPPAAGGIDAAVAARAAPPAAAPARFDQPDETVETAGYVPRPGPGPQADTPPPAVLADPAYHRRAAELVRDAARALDHAHAEGVVHRDIKPGNLMVDRAGRVRVIDFGVARFFDDLTLTHTGQLVGTPLYMSPEQVVGRAEVDGRADVYSLGLVLLELLTLRPPLAASTREELLRRVVTKPLAPVSRANPAVPRALEAVAHKAAAKDPDDRYPSAGAFADDLQRFLDGRPVEARPYRGRADEGEVVAARPRAAVAAAVGHGSVAVFMLTQLAVVGAVAAVPEGRANWGDEWRAGIASYVGLSAAVAAAAGGTAAGVLRGARWGWWAGVVVPVVLVGLWGWVVVQAAVDAREAGPDAPANPVMWGNLFGLLAAVGGYAGVTVPVLFLRPVRDWFRFARRVRAEAAGRA